MKRSASLDQFLALDQDDNEVRLLLDLDPKDWEFSYRDNHGYFELVFELKDQDGR